MLLQSVQVRSATDAQVGGKARGLARLDELGERVPPWFVVPDDAFQAHLAVAVGDRLETELARAAGLDQHALDDLGASLGRALERAVLDDALYVALREALPALGEGPVAVRSSMAGEDSATASYAGQLETCLHRRGLEEVVVALKRCWASSLAGRVLRYRAGHEGGLPRPHMGVVIQRMVEGEVSGVVFTAHPVTGRRDHALVTAAWGLGEGIVSGLCNTDEIVVGQDEVEVHLADKDVAVRADPLGGPGTVEVPVEAGLRGERCLDPSMTAELVAACRAVAEARGGPQDVEFTVADGHLYLLQARPITSLPNPENHDGPTVVFDNSNIQESYCGVTTPLTFSFASGAYASVYEQTMRAVSLPDSVIEAHRPMLRNLLGLVHGRVYYNINNWYRGLLLLPSFGRNKADMEAMMGLEDPVDFVQGEVLGWADKLRRLPGLARTAWNLWRQIRALDRLVPGFLADFEAAYREVDRASFPRATFSELMDRLEFVRTRMLERWHVPILNDFAVMMASGRLRRMLDEAGLPELYVPLMGGEEGIESTEPTRQLLSLARDAHADGALRRALEAPDAFAVLRREFPAVADRLDRYIERYGDRVMGELKLETVTLREDPEFLLRVLRNYLKAEPLDPDAIVARERAARADAEAALRGKVSAGKARKVLAAARTAVKHRENMRLARTRMFGLVRDAYRALGDRLVEAGRISDSRDVFYLTTDELLAYHEGRSVNAQLGAVAAARQAEFAGYVDAELPHHFVTRGPVHHGNRYAGPQRMIATGRLLQGVGCYPGIVQSELRVILSPRDELDVGGRILCTLRTDPGWAPLFPTAAGILVERGSTLSHSAVVARELGIPAVVGVPGLLSIVSDGERVRLDGAEGTVERLDA